jgi:3-hydroxybutyryl-CoA dehydrogenase
MTNDRTNAENDAQPDSSDSGDIQLVGIVGAGTMGRRIAYGCVKEGIPARLYDIDPAVTKEARRAVYDMLEARRRDGRGSPGRTVSRRSIAELSIHTDLSETVGDADLVIEAVPENIDLKRQVFADIDLAAAPEAWIVTNTSSIPGSWLADATARPERMANVNFGPPDDRKVEVMGHPGTAPETMEAVLGFVRRLGLVPIRVRREIMGYAINRIWRAIKKETLFLVDGGYAKPEDIDRGWMLEWDASMGPCGLMDKVGLDVVRDIEMMYYRESDAPSDRPPPILDDMIEAGTLGVKTGKGFYSYPDPAYQQDGWLSNVS